MANKTVSSATPKAIFDACYDPNVQLELSSKTNIRKQSLTPESRIELDSVIELWDESHRLTGDRYIGLRAAETLHFGAFKVIDYMLASSETPKDGLEKALVYYPLINEGFDLNIKMAGNSGFVELQNPGAPDTLPFQYVDYIFACVLIRIRFSTFSSWNPSRVELTCPMPTDLSGYHGFFGAPIKFNRAINRMMFEKTAIEIPQVNSDPYLCEMLDTHAKGMLKKLSPKGDVLTELGNILRRNLASGNHNLDHSAKTMGLSRRSLQRALKSNGISYRQLLNQIRFEIAGELLKQNEKSMEEISFMLGFSEKSSFYRAFKQWTGKTPSRFTEK